MDKIDLKNYKTLLADYDAFVNEIDALKSVFDILYGWLDCNPKFDDPVSFYDLVCFHEGYFNLLSLALDKMRSLSVDNKKNVKLKYKELREINK